MCTNIRAVFIDAFRGGAGRELRKKVIALLHGTVTGQKDRMARHRATVKFPAPEWESQAGGSPEYGAC